MNARRPSRAWARFDDMRTQTGRLFTGVRRELVASRASEVQSVLNEVDDLTRSGAWAFGFVGYEAAAGLDGTLPTAPPDPDLPLVWFGISDEPAVVPVTAPRPKDTCAWQWQNMWSARRYHEAVRTIRSRIADGDLYQCNLTTRLIAEMDEPELLYARLAGAQRGAYNAYLDLGPLVIVSASPELFFECSAGHIVMRPMKGTAPRGRTLDEDAEVVSRLTTSAKERAENVMIVDLVRNDLARIAVAGSVRVNSLCRPERYETVHQLTSEVQAEICPDRGLVEIFQALFPCGSVTGAPKRSAMGVIAELENTPRGAYCGAIGIVGPPSAPVRARFSVAIRTVVLDRRRKVATYGTGGAVTWSSEPDREHAEAIAKTAVLSHDSGDFQLIETMRYEDGRGFVRLPEHLARIAASAEYFGFAFHADIARVALSAELRKHPPEAGGSRIRLLLHRDGALDVTAGPLPLPDSGPVRLDIDLDPIDSTSCWPYHKTSRRDPYERRLARHHADDVLIINERGEVTESCTANLAALIDGQWLTPPVSSGCLPGVGRGVLLASGLIAERTLTPAALADATELALISSLRDWRPARLNRKVPTAQLDM